MCLCVCAYVFVCVLHVCCTLFASSDALHSPLLNVVVYFLVFSSDIDDCTSISCPVGRVCVDGVNSTTCVCPSGFTGSNCSTGMSPWLGHLSISGSCCAMCAFLLRLPFHSSHECVQQPALLEWRNVLGWNCLVVMYLPCWLRVCRLLYRYCVTWSFLRTLAMDVLFVSLCLLPLPDIYPFLWRSFRCVCPFPCVLLIVFVVAVAVHRNHTDVVAGTSVFVVALPANRMSMTVFTAAHAQRLFVLTDMSRVSLSGTGPNLYFQQSVDSTDAWSWVTVSSTSSTATRSPSWHGVTAPLSGP